MVFSFLRGEDDERLDRIEAIVQEMFERDRREFDLAMSALFGDAPVAVVNPELRSSDQRVNELQRALRQELAVHTSVYGGVDTPAVLVYMSIVKDVERLGDYAKNLVDLARDGADFSTLPDGLTGGAWPWRSAPTSAKRPRPLPRATPRRRAALWSRPWHAWRSSTVA